MVFDGETGHYANTATPAPLHLYGRTKLEGEKGALECGKKFALVLRSPLLSGNSANGDHSLHERLLAQWAQGRITPLHTDEIRQPVSASNLADAAVELCERDLSGVYHWAGADALSRFDIGKRIAEKFALDADCLIVASKLTDTTGAWKRPRDLSMDLHPLRGKLRTRVQTFDTLLDEMQIPQGLKTWYATKTNTPAPPTRLIQGQDF
jgi:dTDP-4-dehydrorhamnose reductase